MSCLLKVCVRKHVHVVFVYGLVWGQHALYWLCMRPSYSLCFPQTGASSVVITDRDTRSAEMNLEQSRPNLEGKNVSVSVLEWGSSIESFRPPYDIILAADVIYIEESFPALIRTLVELSSADSSVLLSCKYRYERDERFFEMLREGGMFEDTVVRRWPGRDDIKVHRLKRIESKVAPS